MSKVKKTILNTLLSIIAITFLIGAYYLATYEVETPTPVNTSAIVQEKAIKYLQERYNEKFEINNLIVPESYHACYKITAFHRSDPHDVEHEVILHGWVTGDEKDDDEITFFDNYTAIKLIPELKEKVSDLVLQDYPECKIHIKFHKEWIQENVNEYASVEEFLKKDEYWKRSMSIDIFTYTEKFDDKKSLKKYSEQLFKQLANDNFRATTEIYFYKDINIYNNISDTIPISNRHWTEALTSTRPICGKDFVYSHSILKESDKLVVDFRDE